jgi:hypothetical protein
VDIYFVDWFHNSVLHGGRCTACCKAHKNFADESVCLTANNVQNEGKFLPFTFAYLCIPASETMLRQKRMSTVVQYHF